MIKLSINIPTYNRSVFLKKNLGIIISQVYDLGMHEQVEINISDNASTDDTRSQVYDIIRDNPKLKICYSRNEENRGPDYNFVSAMKMATGKYSILLGDDDFLKKNGLYMIFEIIKNEQYGIYLSNRTDVNVHGNLVKEMKFMNDIVKRRSYNFADKDESSLFFYETATMGGALSFISSIIYRTAIIDEIGDIDKRMMGTCYSFLYYWWKWLFKGNVILYTNQSYINCTTVGVTNNNYGRGIQRCLVDFLGFKTVAEVVITDDYYKSLFMSVVLKDYPIISLMKLYYKEPNSFCEKLKPLLIEYGWTNQDYLTFCEMCSTKSLIKNLIKSIKNIGK